LIARLKQSVGKQVAVLALSVGALFCLLPSVAVAQDIGTVPADGGIQSADQYPDDLPTTGMTSQAASEPVAGAIATFESSDSIWSFSQEHPEATPAQTTDTVESISDTNLPLIGDGNPNPIAQGQELLPPTVVNPAASEPATSGSIMGEPATSNLTTSEPTMSEATMEEPVTNSSPIKKSSASEPADVALGFKPPLGPSMTKQQLFGLSIIVLTIVLAVLIAGKQLVRHFACFSVIDVSEAKPKEPHRTRASDPRGRLLRTGEATDKHGPHLRCFLNRAPRTREHRRHKGS
jgi:hypothetical protein